MINTSISLPETVHRGLSMVTVLCHPAVWKASGESSLNVSWVTNVLYHAPLTLAFGASSV